MVSNDQFAGQIAEEHIKNIVNIAIAILVKTECQGWNLSNWGQRPHSPFNPSCPKSPGNSYITHLRATLLPSLEQVVRLFNEKLPERFANARPYLDEEFPYADQWFGLIRENKTLPSIDPKIKSSLVERLLDGVLATDLLILLNDNNGKAHLIAIDVTCDPTKRESKLNTIQT